MTILALVNIFCNKSFLVTICNIYVNKFFYSMTVICLIYLKSERYVIVEETITYLLRIYQAIRKIHKMVV